MKRNARKFRLVLTAPMLVALVLAVFGAVSVWAGTIQVDNTDPACVVGSGQADPYGVVYCSIQDAIDDATAGDTINVAAGTYNEYILIGKALTVKSTDGAKETTIDGIGFLYMVKIYSADVTFEGFTVTNPTYEGGSDATGILVGAYLGDPVSNVRILNNIVTQVRSESELSSMYGATGINIGRRPLANVFISGNTITDIKNPDGASIDHTCGINVWDGAEGVVISNNTISDIKYNGIMLQWASNVLIENNNTITGCKTGIRVEPFEGATVSGLTVNFNNFADNSIQVSDEAEALVIEDVLANNTFDRAVTVDHEGASLLHTIWSNIQDGIDNAVAGDDTVHVAAGTYDENIAVNKLLTLLGPNADVNPTTAVRGTEAIINGGGTGDAVTISADGVTINGFEVTNGTMGIVAGAQSGLKISNNIIHHNVNPGYPPDADSQQGCGITIWAAAGPCNNNRIENNVVYSNERQGIFIGTNEAESNSVNNTVRGNKVYDNGMDGYDSFGIQLNYASGNTIENNEVYGHTYTLVSWLASGIYLFNANNNNIVSNSIHDNNNGICQWIPDDTVQAFEDNEAHVNNIVDNTESGIRNFTADAPINATCNWWGHPSGPSGSGTGLGDAVSSYVDFEPWLLAPAPGGACGIWVQIDIKPGSDPNSINLKSKGTIPVAILSTEGFNAPDEVNPSSLKFGPEGEEGAQINEIGGKRNPKPHCGVEDANNDGLPDLVCHFKTQDTGFKDGDEKGILQGVTVESIPLEGRDLVRIVPSSGKKAAELSSFQVSVSPNPVRDVDTATFQVMGTLATQVEEIRVQIYDLSGRLVWEDTALGSELDWHTDCLSGDYLANGIYLYRVQLRIDGSWISQDLGKIAVLR